MIHTSEELKIDLP